MDHRRREFKPALDPTAARTARMQTTDLARRKARTERFDRRRLMLPPLDVTNQVTATLMKHYQAADAEPLSSENVLSVYGWIAENYVALRAEDNLCTVARVLNVIAESSVRAAQQLVHCTSVIDMLMGLLETDGANQMTVSHVAQTLHHFLLAGTVCQQAVWEHARQPVQVLAANCRKVDIQYQWYIVGTMLAALSQTSVEVLTQRLQILMPEFIQLLRACVIEDPDICNKIMADMEDLVVVHSSMPSTPASDTLMQLLRASGLLAVLAEFLATVRDDAEFLMRTVQCATAFSSSAPEYTQWLITDGVLDQLHGILSTGMDFGTAFNAAAALLLRNMSHDVPVQIIARPQFVVFICDAASDETIGTEARLDCVSAISALVATDNTARFLRQLTDAHIMQVFVSLFASQWAVNDGEIGNALQTMNKLLHLEPEFAAAFAALGGLTNLQTFCNECTNAAIVAAVTSLFHEHFMGATL